MSKKFASSYSQKGKEHIYFHNDRYFEKKGDYDNTITLYEQAFIEMEDEKAAYMRQDMMNAYLAALVTIGR